MKWQGALGEVTMREDNHQLLQPLYVSVLEPGMTHTFPRINMGFKTVDTVTADKTRLPTTCKFDNTPS